VGAEVDSIFKIIMINIIRSSHTLVLGLNGFESFMSASEVNVLRNAMRFCLFSTLSRECGEETRVVRLVVAMSHFIS